MKFILALVALCLLGVSLAAGQQTPPASGPVGPAGPVVSDDPPPPAKIPNALPPAGSRRGPIILAPPAAAPLTNFDHWFLFESPGGGFTVKFPAKPTTASGAPIPSMPGFKRYVTSLDTGAGRYFTASYYDYQGHLNSPEFAKTAAMNGILSSTAQHGMEVKTRQTVTKGRCQIDEATLGPNSASAFPPSMRLKVQVFYSGDKLYSIFGTSLGNPDDTRAVDYFLDSFVVNGGCVDAIHSNSAKRTNGKDNGVLDPATGWLHFDSTYGISFLLPTDARTELWEDDAMGRIFTKYTYLSATHGVSFSVEIISPLPRASSKESVPNDNVLDSTVSQLRANLATKNYVLGTCSPRNQGTVLGQECSVTRAVPDQRGRARVFVTSKWTYVLMALRDTESTDQSAEDRFFSSLTIDTK